MARLLSVVLIGLALAALPAALSHGLAGGLAALGLGIGLAVVLGGRPSAAAVTAGAAGALAFVALAPSSLGLAGGACLALASAPRAARARRPSHVGALVSLAFLGGGLASGVLLRFAEAEPSARLASGLVAAVLGGGLVLFPVHDVLGARLTGRAAGERGPLRLQLLRAVAVRRRWERARGGLDRSTRRSVDRAFHTLVEALSRLDASPRARSAAEQRIRTYVAQLTRATRAAERADALDERGDARVLAELRLTGEELDLQAEALAEVERMARDRA